MVLSCPGCHAKHKFRDDLAIDRAIYVRCPECSHMMLISPRINNPANVTPRPEAVKEETPPGLPPEIAAAIASTRGSLWRFELLDLAKEELDSDEVRKLILEKRIGPGDLIAHVDKNDWRRLDDVTAFAPELAQAAIAKTPSSTEDQISDKLEPAPIEEPLPPFWQDFPNVLTYPFVGWGPAALLINDLFLVLAVLSYVSLPLLLFNLAYALNVVRESAEGQDVPPGWEAFNDIFDLAASSFKLVALTLGAFLPVLALNGLVALGPLSVLRAPSVESTSAASEPAAVTGGKLAAHTLPSVLWDTMHEHLNVAGILGNILLTLLVLLYYPMCVAMLATENSILPALQPLRVLNAVRDSASTYRIALGTLAALFGGTFAINWVIAKVAALAGLSLVGLAVRIALLVYTLFVSLHVLGRMTLTTPGEAVP